MEITGHDQRKCGRTPDTLGHRTEIECSLPQLRYRKAVPEKFPVKLPWTGKLISPQTRLKPGREWSLREFPGFIPSLAALGSVLPERGRLTERQPIRDANAYSGRNDAEIRERAVHQEQGKHHRGQESVPPQNQAGRRRLC